MFRHNRQSLAFVSLSFALIVLCEYTHGRPMLNTTSSLSKYGVGKSDMSGGFNHDVETSIVPLAEGQGLHKQDTLNVSGNTDECSGCNNNVETTMAPPAEGYGFFRDPLDILGMRFPRSRMTNLCENRVLMGADNTVHDVRFTRRGARACAEVCTQYRVNMVKNQAELDVHSWPGYCDFMGPTDSQVGPHDLRTACTCAYKVRCDRHTELMLYTFESDCDGNLRVSVTESDRKRYVTAYLLSVYLQDPTAAETGGIL